MAGNIDYRALRAAQNALGRPMAAQATPATITVGIDGSSAVFKNSNFYLRDQVGLYHKLFCYIEDGQTQTEIDNTGYAYDDIP